ncbi:penicillin-binding protein 2 [Sandaracinobacter sp. RS1-74]|uniref:peptidoglycan D,D-transpeptidase FtsI family protein n=1 Tax=Sandaracinobacteroides sayramensis TaxID=2913411 RepID=UPI001EDB65C3|nr:penicillin-binding protein 2 [Sandaracinobacteroides sayramensis]MCG2840480.1 penicillin-binding protein 2 [Sandaracinobacteroides sayramensis]
MSPVSLARTQIRLPGHRQMALGVARQRLAIGILLFGAFTLLLGLRLVELAMFDGPVRHNRPAVASPHLRADIVDRNGVTLASSFEAYALAARPFDIVGDKEVLVAKLSAILPERDPGLIRTAVYHDGKFRYVTRRILPEQAEAIRRLGEPGLTLEREAERLYPHVGLGAHYVGYTGVDGRGEGGIERAFEERLTDPAQRDRPLVLSMDARVQQALESELNKRMLETEAKGAAGVVMDVHSGEVLALASLPAFDSNRPGGLVGMPSHMNRATLGVYELGSTFKAFTIAMALDTGAVTDLGERFSMGPIRVGNHTIRDLHPRASPITVPEVLILSSNTGTAKMAERVGRARQEEFLKKLGMMDRASGEILEKGRTLTPPKNNWGLSAVMTVGFGHGIAVSPLHLAAAYSALVNGGVYRPATFLKAEGERPGERVFTEQTSHMLNGMLRLAVLDGTGRRADAAGYRVGGKTGTAEKKIEGGRGYDRRRNITTFAGAFPMDDPRYVIVTMIDEPQGANRQAGFVVGPVSKNVVNRIAPVLGVAPSDTKDVDVSEFDGLWKQRAVRGEASVR